MIKGVERLTAMIEEKIIYDGKISFKTFWVSSGLLSFLLLGWNLGLLSSFLKSRQYSLKITSQRVEFVKGIVTSQQESIELYRASDTDYSQSLLQKLFGVGYVRLISADSTAPLVQIPVSNPRNLRDQIRECIRDERQRLGTIHRD